MTNMLNKSETKLRARRKAGWLIFLLIAVAAVAMVLVPTLKIMPFKPQTARDIELSYALRRWAPLATAGASVIALALAVWLWQGAGRWRWLRRAALVLLLVPPLAAAWFARQNHFEWIFNPLRAATHTAADEARFVGDGEMVMAVELNNDAVAYPVRQVAYHHVIQDTVGGVPIVVTY